MVGRLPGHRHDLHVARRGAGIEDLVRVVVAHQKADDEGVRRSRLQLSDLTGQLL